MANEKKFFDFTFQPRLHVLERLAPKSGLSQQKTVVFMPGNRIGEYMAFEAAQSSFGTDEQDMSIARTVGSNPTQDPDIPTQATYTREQLKVLVEQGYQVVIVKADDAGPEQAKPYTLNRTEGDGNRIGSDLAGKSGFRTQGGA